MDSDFENRLKATKKVSLKKSIDFLKRLNIKHEFKIKSEYETINNISLKLVKGNRTFKFKMNSFNLVKNMSDQQSEGYGLAKPFEINSAELGSLILKRGVSSYSWNLHSDIIEGTIDQLSSKGFDKKPNSYFQAFLPIKDLNSQPNYLVENEMLNIDSRIIQSGLLEIPIQGTKFLIYSFQENNDYNLVIENRNSLSCDSFQKITECISFSLAFISGILLRNELTIISYVDKDFELIDGFYYKVLPDSIYSGKAIFLSRIPLPKIYDQVNRTLPKEVFEKLITLCLEEEEVLNSIKIMTQSNNLPMELIISSYCVGLEAIKNYITKNLKGVRPIKKPKIASSIRKKLLNIINSYDETFFNSRNAILQKINNINQETNTDGFISAFEKVNYKLSEYDLYCIDLRNKFLHGQIPLHENINHELTFIIYKLHFLVSVLILKTSGYNGYLLNNVTYLKVMLNHKKITEPLFIQV